MCDRAMCASACAPELALLGLKRHCSPVEGAAQAGADQKVGGRQLRWQLVRQLVVFLAVSNVVRNINHQSPAHAIVSHLGLDVYVG